VEILIQMTSALDLLMFVLDYLVSFAGSYFILLFIAPVT